MFVRLTCGCSLVLKTQWLFIWNGARGAVVGDTVSDNSVLGPWRRPGSLLRIHTHDSICVLHAGGVLGGNLTFAGAIAE